jgi:hypothetical protein
MKLPEHIEKQVAETMASLDGTSRATANPFLYTRIRAAMEAEESGFWSKTASFMTRPIVAVATVLVILLMNSLIFINNQDSRSNSNIASQDEDQLLSREYSVASINEENLYTLNEEQP